MKLILSAIVAVLLLWGCGKEVTLENQKWTYENGVCVVTFKLLNHEHADIDLNIRIAAHKLRDFAEGAIINDIIGEKVAAVKLRPYEEKELTETLTLFPNRRPDMVVVTHYGAK